MFAGFGSAEQTNERFHALLRAGQTGLSTAFDLPTLMGYDSDHPFSKGEVGKCGVAVSSLADMEILFQGIDPTQVTTSMTINSPANAVWAMYIANAQKQGKDLGQVGGTIQNDILKEFIAQKEFIYPPAPSVKLVIDTFEWGPRIVPKWNFISVSGYHIREAGATGVATGGAFGAATVGSGRAAASVAARPATRPADSTALAAIIDTNPFMTPPPRLRRRDGDASKRRACPAFCVADHRITGSGAIVASGPCETKHSPAQHPCRGLQSPSGRKM